MNLKHILLLGFCFISAAAVAQESTLNPNPNSAHPIDEADIQYRAQIWRRMDLNEKINQPFFAENNQISKFLIDGVKAGLLIPYSNDSLNTKLSLEQFIDRLKIKGKLDNGGLTAEYRRIRASLKYQLWRKEILKRDKFTCVLCGSKFQLEVDHIKSFAHFPNLRFIKTNGRVLCKHFKVSR
jgi:hypothetical protein